MPDYKALYFHLFNSISDTIERLKQAQQEAEELFLSDEAACSFIVMRKQPKSTDNSSKNPDGKKVVRAVALQK